MASRFTSISKNLCPRCHTGKVFKHNFTFNPKKFDKMHTNCSQCSLKYERNWLFCGAMYVSYGLTAGWVIATFVINALWFDIDAWSAILLVTIPIVAMVPFTFRISRLVWLNLFFHFDPEFKKDTSINN